jgi:cobalt-zinc-cadmium efflux system outer membrane protein
LRRAQQTYWAFGVDLRSGARALHQRLLTARRRAEHVQSIVLPLSNQIVHDTQLQYNGMQLGVFQLLRAKEDQISAGLQYIETLRDYWLERTEMDQLLSGHLSGDLNALVWGAPDMINTNMRIEER